MSICTRTANLYYYFSSRSYFSYGFSCFAGFSALVREPFEVNPC
jgi:hypothetical protein